MVHLQCLWCIYSVYGVFAVFHGVNHKKHYKKQKKQTGGFRGSQKISPLATPLYQSQGISRRFSAILGFAEKHRETPRIGLYYRKGYIKAMGRCFYGFF